MSVRCTTEGFIEKALRIHKCRYDYSNVNYITTDTKVDIICREHGTFKQKPSNHINGQGCPKCGAKKRAKTYSKTILNNRKQNGAKDRIPLSNGSFCLIDEEDYDELSKHNWSSICKGSYANNNKVGLMHRYILKVKDRNIIVDHVNHNGLDNRKCNLRPCTKQQNHFNQRTQNREKTSMYKGVFWDKKRNKWQSSIKHNGVRIYLGRFNCEKEAALTYNSKAIELFKEFANLNDV